MLCLDGKYMKNTISEATKKALYLWLPLALFSLALPVLVYASVQQAYRLSANDPQIEMAEDAADQLKRGEEISAVFPGNRKVEVTRSLAPFSSVLGEDGKILVSSGELNGKPMSLPQGVLDYTKVHGEDRLTWQPQVGVRLATVVVHFSGVKSGYVLVGRSLREVEQREGMVAMYTGLAAGVLIITSFLLTAWAVRSQAA
jgi:hypothetical protein